MRALPSFDPRRPPLRWLLRMPILLYGLGLGWLLGGRFVLLTVRGRKTGLSRPVVLEVLGPDPQTGGLFVASAWGGSAQWLRNLEACPERGHGRQVRHPESLSSDPACSSHCLTFGWIASTSAI